MGAPFEAMIEGATMRGQPVPVTVSVPSDPGLCDHGPRQERFAGVLPAQLNPEHDKDMICVLERIGNMLTPEQLSFIKAPSGWLTFGADQPLNQRTFRSRKPFSATAEQVGGGHRAQRLLPAAGWLAAWLRAQAGHNILRL